MDPVEEKTCTQCRKSMPIGCFRTEKRTKIGLQSCCKFCESAYRKKHRAVPEVSKARKEYLAKLYERHTAINAANPEAIDKEKYCPICQLTKLSDQFDRAHKRRGGLATQCKSCSREFARKYLERLKVQVFDKLGWLCKRCEFKDIRALQIDHVFGGGNREHKALKNARKFLKTVIADTTGAYQILCANCNWIKRYEKDENPTYEKQREISAAGETCNDAATSPTRSSPTLNSSASNP